MILVTGNRGFLGSALTSKLENYRGYDIKDGFDLNDTDKLREVLEGVEAVVHLAAIVGEPACLKDVARAYQVNTLGTWNLVDLARAMGVRKLIMASTCSVYGDCGEELVDESSPVKPWGVYTTCKFFAETYVTSYEYTVLRFGSLYGGGGSGLPEVMKREAQRGEIVVRDAESWRPLTHVEDAARAIVYVLHRRSCSKVLNVVGENIRKRDLAKYIAQRSGARVKLEKGVGRSYKVISRRIWELGFKFKWTLMEWLDENSFVGAPA